MKKTSPSPIIARGSGYLRQSRTEKVRPYSREVEPGWFEFLTRSVLSETPCFPPYVRKSNMPLPRAATLEHETMDLDRSRQIAEYQHRHKLSADRQQIVAALEDRRFKWRTIRGVSRQLDIPESDVNKLLNKLIDEGVAFRSTVPASDGSGLYTTRRHFRSCSSFWQWEVSLLTDQTFHQTATA
jgi:hypothetical protein